MIWWEWQSSPVLEQTPISRGIGTIFPGELESQTQKKHVKATRQSCTMTGSLPSLWRTHLGPYLVSMGYAIKNWRSISSRKKTLVTRLKIPIQEKRSPSKKPASKGVKIATKTSKEAQSVSHFLVLGMAMDERKLWDHIFFHGSLKGFDVFWWYLENLETKCKIYRGNI